MKKFYLLTALALATSLYFGEAARPAVVCDDPAPTSAGMVRGMEDSPGVCVWKGIPYAAPPVGDLRWRAPEPHPGWSGVKDADEFGNVCIQGDAMISGSLNMPEESGETFDKDGWLHPGDMGYMDEDGRITLRGLKKKMCLQGGYNVYPAEAENLFFLATGVNVSLSLPLHFHGL